jgi:hypothetical protein
MGNAVRVEMLRVVLSDGKGPCVKKKVFRQPPSALLVLKMATATYIGTMEQLQHNTGQSREI